MKAKKIINAIKEHYFSVQTQGEEGERKSSSMSKLDMCSYYALLSSLSEDELEEAEKLTVAYEILDLWYIVNSFKNRKLYNSYSKNETIDTLLQRFTNRKSKRVVESRKELQTRFPYLSFSEQKKIVKAFLESTTVSDVEWAALEADRRWDKSYCEAIAAAFERKGSQKLAITIIRHMPLDYIEEREASLAMFSRSELCIRLSSRLDNLRKKYDLSIFEYLYVVARSRANMNMTKEGVEKEFFKYLFMFCNKTLLGVYPSRDQIEYIPWIRRVIWALGELKCDDILYKFLQMKSYSQNAHMDNPGQTELYWALEWIIEHYFPNARQTEEPDFKRASIAVENYLHPRTIKINSIEDLDEFDDLSPDTIKMLSDFI